MTTVQSETINGINVPSLRKLVADVTDDPRIGLAKFAISTAWKSGTVSETRVDGWGTGRQAAGEEFQDSHR